MHLAETAYDMPTGVLLHEAGKQFAMAEIVRDGWQQTLYERGGWFLLLVWAERTCGVGLPVGEKTGMTEVALWQYRWLNPGDDTNVTPDMLAWKEITPWNPRMQTMEQRIEELRSFRYNGKPAYEVRALGVINGVEVDCDCDGELLIDWSPGKGRMLSMTLRADGRLSYAFTWDGEQAHGTARMPPAHGVDLPDGGQR